MSITKDIIYHYQSAFFSRSTGFGVNGTSQLRINTPSNANVAQVSLGRWKRMKGKNIAESNKRKKDASQTNPVLHSTANLHIGSITALQNTEIARRCGFYSGSHVYTITNCPKRKTLQDNGQEYDISKKNFISSLFCTIESAMSIVRVFDTNKKSVIDNLSPD